MPFVTTPVRLARAAAMLARFAADQRRLLPRRPPEVTTPKGLDLPAGAVTLNEAESKAVLRAFGIPVVKEVFVAAGGRRGRRRPQGWRRRLRSRSSPAISPHKTEAGGVKLGVAKDALADAVRSGHRSTR